MTEIPPKTYDIGDSVRLRGTFTDPDTDFPRSPTTVTIRVRQPNDVTLTVTATETPGGSGVYIGYFEPTLEGDHWYSIAGDGTYKARGERRFTVRKRRVT